MADELLNGQTQTNSEIGKITYSQYGFKSAQKSQSQPASIDGYLDNVYGQFLEEQKLDEQGLKDRISRLKAELQSEKTKKNDANAEISSHKSFKEDKEKQIEELEIEKIDIRNGDGEIGDTSSFILGAFILLFLTLFLILFYSSAGYSAIYSVKKGSLDIINPDVFSDAGKLGGGAIGLIILFPFIFLTLGFLIHISIENNKKLFSEGKSKKYLLIIFLLIFAFIVDSIIGYKISEKIHENKFNAGLTDEIWKFKMIFEETNFYFILGLGFVVYIFWGYLLNFFLSHSYLKTENEKVKLMIENVNNRITDKRKELSEIISKINKFESDIITCESKIQEKEKDIIGYENGVIPINISSLKGSIGEFMGGWQNYTNNNLSANLALPLIDNAIKAQNVWIANKIQNLNSDN